jgi:DNA (cytosine-5)-methyltransferase 1
MTTIKAADLFCGAGGASTGLVRACAALGLKLDLLAVNHWPIAVETHSANHPTVRHLCESVERIDPRVVVPGGRLHLLLAGPECTHFSTARGGRPVNPQSRASAWHILKWAQELYIDTILIENVPEFRTWGPIGADMKPLKSKRGETYRAFLTALQVARLPRRGPHPQRRGLRGPDDAPAPLHHGAPRAASGGGPGQSRRTARADSRRSMGARSAGAARDVIDWSISGKSIFHRKRPLKPATIARILAGLRKFGGPELQPFLVLMEHGGRLGSVDRPLPTITTAKGGAIGVAQPFLVRFKGTSPSHLSASAKDVDAPVPTMTAEGGQFGIVSRSCSRPAGRSVLPAR